MAENERDVTTMTNQELAEILRDEGRVHRHQETVCLEENRFKEAVAETLLADVMYEAAKRLTAAMTDHNPLRFRGPYLTTGGNSEGI